MSHIVSVLLNSTQNNSVWGQMESEKNIGRRDLELRKIIKLKQIYMIVVINLNTIFVLFLDPSFKRPSSKDWKPCSTMKYHIETLVKFSSWTLLTSPNNRHRSRLLRNIWMIKHSTDSQSAKKVELNSDHQLEKHCNLLKLLRKHKVWRDLLHPIEFMVQRRIYLCMKLWSNWKFLFYSRFYPKAGSFASSTINTKLEKKIKSSQDAHKAFKNFASKNLFF